MICICKAEFLAKEDKVSSKGNKYTVLLFMQGTEAQRLMCTPIVASMNFEKGKEYLFELTYQFQFKKFTITNASNSNG